jgi:sodium-dependent dicarboxylate transporter 2/3/5
MLLGIPSGSVNEIELAQSFGNKMVFLFFGGFVIAIAIEKHKLHRYFAELIVGLIGKSPVRILAGFMISTAFLSMWISNTATTLMMLPMALAVNSTIPRFREKRKFTVALLLSIAFSANIGGTATLIGTPPNVQMAGILEDTFGVTIGFFQWFSFAFPLMVTLLFISFLSLRFIFLQRIEFKAEIPRPKKLTKPQMNVLLVFSLVIFLWSFSQPIQALFGIKMNDTSVALLGAFLMFIVPENRRIQKSLLNWGDLKKLPWGILLLFGGGLALAKMLSNSGTLNLVVDLLSSFGQLKMFILFLIIFMFAIFSTELMSNLALVSLLVPVMGEFAQTYDLPLLGMAAGIAISSSCAFMLPVATPPNAIVFGANIIPMRVMIKVGFLLNVISLTLITIVIYWISI